MSRVKFDLPDHFPFTTEIHIRISDINYGGHLGNDAVLSIVHEARVRFLKHHGFTEADIGGAGIIMTDAVIIYRSEGFYGQVLKAQVGIMDMSKIGCDFVFCLTDREHGTEIARAKTGVVFYDYEQKKVLPVPSVFRTKFADIH
jgi:acyl-CoA thioester hydrolase